MVSLRNQFLMTVALAAVLYGAPAYTQDGRLSGVVRDTTGAGVPGATLTVTIPSTMRLGLYPCKLLPGSLAHKAYGEEVVYERHRHRFEFNNEYRESLGEDRGRVVRPRTARSAVDPSSGIDREAGDAQSLRRRAL